MAFRVVGTEEWWGNGAALTIIQLSAHSFPCRGWSRSAAGCWCLAHWHRPDCVGCEPMEDNNSIGVWRIRVKSNSPDFHFDSDRLMSWSWMPPPPLPDWWISLFTPPSVFNVGAFLTGWLFWKEQHLHLLICIIHYSNPCVRFNSVQFNLFV